jgi:DNA-directed RNA polymerase subunit beta'
MRRIKIHTNGQNCRYYGRSGSSLGCITPEIQLEDVNRDHDQSSVGQVIAKLLQKIWTRKTVELLDCLKNMVFKYATKSGLSIAVDDMAVPPEKRRF